MFKRISLFLLVFANLLFAKVQDVELLASEVVKEGDIVTANGDVVAYSQDYFLTADRAVYDQKNEILELFGNVNAIKSKKEIVRTNYLKLNLREDETFSTSTFMMDQEAEIWAQSDETCSDDKYYRTKGSIVSSCNIQDPDWKITYTSGKLNKESKFLHLFNPVFYAGEVPILYLPYFGFPTDKTRRTGLLIPEGGYISSQGFYYKQPIYFAPYKSWDFQLDPQIRTRRGMGLYGTFRFADSPYSYGEIRGGAFFNKKKHQKRLEYKNQVNKGFEIEYERSKLAKYLLSGDFKEKLWMDINVVNDLEYFDLIQRDGIDDDDDSLVTSKFNYYATTNDHYLGLYARYYIDTEKLSEYNRFKNKDTVQELPSVQYHKFTESLFVPNLFYSIDTNFHNYTRRLGVTARQYDINIPITYTTPIFNDWLNFKFQENFYATQINYENNYKYNGSSFDKHNSDTYINHYHLVGVSTDLVKPYENFYHTMYLEGQFLEPGYQHGSIDDRLFKDYQYKEMTKNGRKVKQSVLENVKNKTYYEDSFVNELSKDYTQRNISGKFTQYFFGNDGHKYVRHSIKTKYDFEDEEFGNLDNRIDIYLKNGLSFGNRFEYSLQNNNFEKSQTYVRYSNKHFSTYFSHHYEYVKSYGGEKTTNYDKDNYLKFGASVNLPEHYKIFGRVEYDLQNSYTKMWRLGLTANRKCWNYSLVYQEDIEPKTTSRHSIQKAEKERGIYLFVNFYPFGGVRYHSSMTEDYEN